MTIILQKTEFQNFSSLQTLVHFRHFPGLSGLGDFKNVRLGTQNRQFFMQLVQLWRRRSCGRQQNGISTPYSCDSNPLYRSNEFEVYSGRLQTGRGRRLGVRVTSGRLPLPGR